MNTETARSIAHELFAHECSAFNGTGKPHSRRCQQAADRLEEWCGQRQLLEALIAAHRQVDTLLAMLVSADHTFMPSQSALWPDIVARHGLIQQHREAHERERPRVSRNVTRKAVERGA